MPGALKWTQGWRNCPPAHSPSRKAAGPPEFSRSPAPTGNSSPSPEGNRTRCVRQARIADADLRFTDRILSRLGAGEANSPTACRTIAGRGFRPAWRRTGRQERPRVGQPQEQITDTEVRENAGIQYDFEVGPHQDGPGFGFGKYKSERLISVCQVVQHLCPFSVAALLGIPTDR